MTEVIANAAEGEVMYRERVPVRDGEALVETVNFPPLPPLDMEREDGYEYCGFETLVTLPDGTQYGNGPEYTGETPLQCHETAVEGLRKGSST